MLGIFTGTFFDVGMVLVGCIFGSFVKTDLMGRIGDRVYQTFAILVLVIGISSAVKLDHMYLILGSVIVGVSIGEIIDLDSKITKLGYRIESKLEKSGDLGNLGKAFTQSTMVLCIGAMTVMGALQSGISNTHSILFIKGVIDGVLAIVMRMGMGPGVFLSLIPLLIYESLLVIGAGWVSPLMTAPVTGAFNAVGGLLLIGVALNMLKITDLKVVNFMLAMFVPILYGAFKLLIA